MLHKTLIWLRNDLRLHDNPALNAGLNSGGAVTALYIHEEHPSLRKTGAAAQWWLERSLQKLHKALQNHGVELLIRTGDPMQIIMMEVHSAGFSNIFWNRRYAHGEREIDAQIKAELRSDGFNAQSFKGSLLTEPWEVSTLNAAPYKVFGAYARAARQFIAPVIPDTPSPVETKPQNISPVPAASQGIYNWGAKLEPLWEVGEDAAHSKLEDFLSEKLATYHTDRDLPYKDATSVLSMHLRFGEISPRQIWNAAAFIMDTNAHYTTAVDKLFSELLWRDFHYYQLFHLPDITRVPMRDTLDNVPWHNDEVLLRAWKQGKTGLPIVDAGMRQLWQTGTMHNRVRMLTASLLTKNMLTDWHIGEEWFWDTLLDADVASNPGNWQWVAGCGLDAAPYFRIFNPVVQGQRFDPEGDYVRQWVPELAQMPSKWIHRPFEAPENVLRQSGVKLGIDYPLPVVDLATTQRFFKQVMKG